MEQAQVWPAQKSSRVTELQVQERRVVELENIIGKLTDAIEAGQPVGRRLGAGDPVTIRSLSGRSASRRSRSSRTGQGGWRFHGEGDFSGIILGNGHKRVKAAPQAPALEDGPAEPGRPSDSRTLLRPRRTPYLVLATCRASGPCMP